MKDCDETCISKVYIFLLTKLACNLFTFWGHRGHDRVEVGLTSTCASSACHL